MEIARIEIENFRGKNFNLTPDRVNLFFRKNGSGKTTLCDAVRYGITGLKPKDGVNNARVRIVYGNGLDTERTAGKLTVCRVNGRKVTAEALNAAVEEYTGVPLETIKVASSSEVFMSLKPKDFLALLMTYIPEQLDRDIVMGYFPAVTTDMMEECGKVFPEPPKTFGIELIDKAYDTFCERRRNLNAEIRSLTSQIAALPKTKPNRTLAQIDEELTAVAGKESFARNVQRLVNEYARAVQNREAHAKRIRDIEAAIAKLSPEKADTAAMAENNTKTKELQAEKSKCQSDMAVMTKNIETYVHTLENLDKPYCPISEKLVCTTDKTAVKDDLNALLEDNRKVYANMAERLQKLNADLEALEAARTALEKMIRAQAQRESLVNQLEYLKANIPPVPEKPQQAEDAGQILKQKQELMAERTYAMNYGRYVKLADELSKKQKELATCAAIAEALGDKGEVKRRIIQYYTESFEQICNERAAKFAAGYSVRFVPDDGVNVLVKTPSNNGYYPISSLSNGESIAAVFIISDMLSQLSGSRILFVDNVEALDADSIVQLRQLADSLEFQEGYDHIFICGVNHDSVTAAFDGMLAGYL